METIKDLLLIFAAFFALFLIFAWDSFNTDEIKKLRKIRDNYKSRAYYNFEKFYKDVGEYSVCYSAKDELFGFHELCVKFDFVMNMSDRRDFEGLRAWYEFRKIYRDPCGILRPVYNKRLEEAYWKDIDEKQYLIKNPTMVRFGSLDDIVFRNRRYLDLIDKGTGEKRVLIHTKNKWTLKENTVIAKFCDYERAIAISCRQILEHMDPDILYALNKAYAPCSEKTLVEKYIENFNGDIILHCENRSIECEKNMTECWIRLL